MTQNPFNLPKSEEFKYEPFIFPKVNNNILLLADLHIPYHSISALNCAIRYGKEHEINTIYLNGDVVDFHQLSRFVRDPRKRSVKEELNSLKQFLDCLATEFPSAKIYYKEGNHEKRYETYVKTKCAELLGIDEFELETSLGLPVRGIEMISDERVAMAGKLPILHGHEFQKGSTVSVNPARTALLRAKHCVVVSHSHVTSMDCKNKVNGEMLTAWSTGCLCELHPEYARLNDWNHGFTHIRIDKNGLFNVQNIRVYRGDIL